jgi:hypothetical protein
MWILPTKPNAIRFLKFAAALAAVLMGGVLSGTAQAESRVSAVIRGTSITVVGGSNSSIDATEGKTVVMVDGRKIVIGKGRIRVANKVHDIGRFTEIRIDSREKALKIYVDGRILK